MVNRSPFPIAGGSQPLQLIDDDAAVFLLPVPHAFQESFPAQLMPRQPLRRKMPLHHILRRYSGMVGAGHPEHFKSLQALVPAENILQGVVESMPHMQLPGHIGRGDDNTEGRLRAVKTGMKLIPLAPSRRTNAILLPEMHMLWANCLHSWKCSPVLYSRYRKSDRKILILLGFRLPIAFQAFDFFPQYRRARFRAVALQQFPAPYRAVCSRSEPRNPPGTHPGRRALPSAH